MCSLSRYLARAVILALLTTIGFADSVFLKNGEKVEGKIVAETEQQVTVAVQVSAGITDERVIARADILRVEKVSPETEAYKAIAAISPGPNSFAPAQYDPPIRALQDYLTQYPTSLRAVDVKNALNELLAEKKRVEDGEVKVRGQWLPKAEAEKEKVQLDGLRAFEHMKTQSAAGDGIGALNTFAAIEKNYAGAATMPDCIELARQIVASLKPAIERAGPNQKAFKAEKERGFASASAPDRVEMKEAYKNEQAQADATVVAAEAAGLWPPFIATSEKSLSALLARTAKESTRLAALPVDKMKQSLQLTTTAKQKISAGEFDAAAAVLKEATTLWAANELAVRLSKEVAERQKGGPGPNPSVPVPVIREPMAATPQPGTLALSATPPPAGSSPASPGPKAATPKPATPKPSAALRLTTPIPAAPTPDAKPFYLTLPGAIAIVVGIAAILAGLNVYKKMKARKNEPVE